MVGASNQEQRAEGNKYAFHASLDGDFFGPSRATFSLSSALPSSHLAVAEHSLLGASRRAPN
jgi:hypothetical protein